jgi:AcrR family transcriptional regulator
MSSAGATRQRIMDATRGLLENGTADVTMGRIAAAAGVSRQLLYLHFASRGELLLAVTRAVDEEVRPTTDQQRVEEAPDARTALREAVALQGRIKPRIAGVAAALDRLRASDADAARAWQEREDARHARARAVVERLAAEGLLVHGLSVDDAARLLWSVTSQHAWAELVQDTGWSTRRWTQRTTQLLERALTGSVPPAASAPADGR